MALTEGQVADFRDKGYIVLKGFFGRDEVTRMSAWLDALREKDPADEGDAKYYETSGITGETVLVRVEHVVGDHNPGVEDLLLPSGAVEALTQLLGEQPVLFKEKVNYKIPGSRADKLHQDQAAGWNRYCDYFITMAIAVDPNTRENAALSFRSAGNHKHELIGPEWEPLSEDDPPWPPEHEYSLIEAEPGDVILFDSYVPHGSPPNTSDADRRNIYLTFNRASDGDMRAQYYRDKWANYAPNDAGRARAEDTYLV